MRDAIFLDDALRHFAEATPKSHAAEFLGDTFSYARLNDKADQIASFLVAAGVRNGDRVVICAAKSLMAIATVYAVLRIGAVYVPIDPSAPSERMLAQTKAVTPRFVVTDTARIDRFTSEFDASQILDLAQDLPDGLSHEAAIEQSAKRQTVDPAYILMTSGSTGAPKGIVHTHKSALSYARMAGKLCELHAADRVSNHTPLHFDMSVFDIFSTSLAGACVVVIPEMHAKLPASLSQLTEQSGITVWYSVPFALTQMVERGVLDDRDLSAIRIVMFAGETMPPATLKRFSKHTPNARYLNAYGPTETNHCTTATFFRSDLDGVSALPIGTAADGTIARVGEAPVEVDEGELLISSPQVMNEYWQDAKRTEEVFTDLTDRQGVVRRFYRTGDLVSRSETGDFVLIGRKDRQVKIRGFRIELDEIEIALMNTSNVIEAAVIVVDQTIYAFVTGGTRNHLPSINDNVRSVLPQHAIPHSIEWLDAMPRTSTGKIDRTTLTERANARHAA